MSITFDAVYINNTLFLLSSSTDYFCHAWLPFCVRGKKMPASLVDSALLDSEASVLATLDFLGQDGMEDEDNLRYLLILA